MAHWLSLPLTEHVGWGEQIIEHSQRQNHSEHEMRREEVGGHSLGAQVGP